MKKQMETRIAIKRLFILISIMYTLTSIGQEKNLLFDSVKDSILNLDSADYYRVESNLFDINRYSQIDTIPYSRFNTLKISSINELYKIAQTKSKAYLEKGINEGKIRIIETNNQIFEYIYIIEKISKCKYKRTRVWWVDY